MKPINKNAIEVREDIDRAFTLTHEEGLLTVFNPLGIERNDLAYLHVPIGQPIIDVCGRECYAADLGSLPAWGAKTIEVRDLPADLSLKFHCSEDLRIAHTRFLTVRFDHDGFIESLYDAAGERELRRSDSEPLNALHLYDHDMGTELPCKLIDRRLCACGAFEMRIRSEYAIGNGSTLTQDAIFSACTTRIDFHTCIRWSEPSARLTTTFDLALTDAAIRGGEPSWTDLSEGAYGAALFNNAARAVSADGTRLCLTLHDGKTPERGICELTYSLLLHQEGFRSENTVHPAYCLNHPIIERRGGLVGFQAE